MIPHSESIRGRLIRQWRPAILGAWIILIVLAAHQRWLGPSAGWTFAVVAPLGMDISMTPLTVDMMYGDDIGERPPYARRMELTLLLTNGTEVSLPLREASLPLFKLPFLLGAELGPPAHLGFGGFHNRGLCRALAYSGWSALSFKVTSDPAVVSDPLLGLNQAYRCSQ